MTAEHPKVRPADTVEIDASGLSCPLPVLKALKALLGMRPGEVVILVATDPMAAIDVPHFCSEAGHVLAATERDGTTLRFRISRGEDRPARLSDDPA